MAAEGDTRHVFTLLKISLFSSPVILSLGSPDVLVLQLPEILASRASGIGICGPKVGSHWSTATSKYRVWAAVLWLGGL